jgi:hypothetical protein
VAPRAGLVSWSSWSSANILNERGSYPDPSVVHTVASRYTDRATADLSEYSSNLN